MINDVWNCVSRSAFGLRASYQNAQQKCKTNWRILLPKTKKNINQLYFVLRSRSCLPCLPFLSRDSGVCDFTTKTYFSATWTEFPMIVSRTVNIDSESFIINARGRALRFTSDSIVNALRTNCSVHIIPYLTASADGLVFKYELKIELISIN